MSEPELQEESTLLGARSRRCPRWLLIIIVLVIMAILVIAITTVLAYDYKQDDPTPTHKNVLPEPIKRPHILLIVADDLGFDDVGYQGSKIRTPVIDELATSGVKLENYYTHQLCSPSRAALMSGYYASNLGMQHNTIKSYQPYGLPLGVETLPEVLRETGYSTHMMGKWHLGFFSDEYLPNYRGFDTFLGFVTGDEDYYRKLNCVPFTETWCGQDLYNNTGNDTQLVEDEDTLTTYSTNLYTQEAVRIISQHDPSQPMFMYMSYQAPHTPLEVPEEYLQEYSWMDDTLLKTYAAMITCMDEGIGNITDALKQRQMWDNTLVVFASDNGAVPWGENSAGSNWPLSGRKGTMWDGALRVPALLSGSVIPEVARGRSSSTLMHVTDWSPTLIQLAGKEPPVLDGYPMWDVIINDAVTPRHEVFHIYDPLWVVVEPYTPSIYSQIVNVSETSALLVDHWKIMTGEPGSCQRIAPHYLWREHPPIDRPCNSSTLVWLFDLENDPYELYNLVDERPEVALRMINRLAEYQAGSVYPLSPHPDYRANPAYYHDRWVPWTSSPWVDMFNASVLLDKKSQTELAHPTLSP